ncbi:MAG: STAS domain-containing protein [Phycisphaerales bacterium]|mgnify:CR=1 FL=1|jgi:anti-anti-sigma factor|nr:STAS domain-containing protein [Phycisphaerales bacterium]
MTEYRKMNGFNSNNGTDKRRSLFVDVTYSNGVMGASIVGPRIGEREATIVANAVNAKLKDYGSKVKSLVLDFSEIQFISSLGLGMCIDVRNTAEKVNATTTIIGLTPHLNELFVMMRLDCLFHIDSTQHNYGSAA